LDIELVFTNVTPFHSSAPGGARVTLEGQFVGERQGFPCTRTRFMPVMGGADGDGVPTPVYVPLMPANTLRHVLREALLTPIMEHFRGRYTLSTGSYAAAHAGNASGNPDGVTATYDEIVSVRQHPFLGLFGGGPRMVEGRLRVDAAWPITRVTLPYLGELEEHAVRGHLTNVQFIVDHKVETTGFSRSALAAKIRRTSRGAEWNTDTAATRFFRSSTTLYGSRNTATKY
jgi:CRISPR type IV-associated protein Csf2